MTVPSARRAPCGRCEGSPTTVSAQPSSRRRAKTKISQSEVIKLVRKVMPPSQATHPDTKRRAARVRVKRVDLRATDVDTDGAPPTGG